MILLHMRYDCPYCDLVRRKVLPSPAGWNLNLDLPPVRYEDNKIIVMECKVSPSRDDLAKISGQFWVTTDQMKSELNSMRIAIQREHGRDSKEESGPIYLRSAKMPEALRREFQQVVDDGLIAIAKTHETHFSNDEWEFLCKLIDLIGYEVRSTNSNQMSHAVCIASQVKKTG